MSGVMDPSDRVPLPACLPEFEEESRRATGLSDFGPGEYREGLACFLEACEIESNLTPAGRLTVKEQVVTGLKGRLLSVSEKEVRIVPRDNKGREGAEVAVPFSALRHAQREISFR